MTTTTTMPLISIIVPVYNVQDYLRKCLDSALQQTYNNIEIILIDDGSTDSSGDICDYYSTIDSRIRVIHQTNGGISVARNVGFTASHGEYIIFLDSDDFIHPQMLSLMLYELQQNNADLVCCHKKRVEPNFPFPTNTVQPKEYSVTLYKDYKAFHELYTSNYTTMVVCWNKLYSRALVSSFPFPQGRIHEDEFFSPRILSITKTVALIEYPFYYYVQRPGSIMNRSLSKKSIDKLICIAENAAYFQKTDQPDKSVLESIRFLDYAISFCVTFRTQNDKKLEKKVKGLFADIYRTLDKKALSISKRVKYAFFNRFYSLFIWQEIHLRKLRHNAKR